MSKKHIEECVRTSLEGYFKDLRGTEPDGMYDQFQFRTAGFNRLAGQANSYYAYKFKGRNNSKVTMLWSSARPFYASLKVDAKKVAFYNREYLQGLVYTADNSGNISLPVSGVPCFISTEVTPQMEEATQAVLTGNKEIRGMPPGVPGK